MKYYHNMKSILKSEVPKVMYLGDLRMNDEEDRLRFFLSDMQTPPDLSCWNAP